MLNRMTALMLTICMMLATLATLASLVSCAEPDVESETTVASQTTTEAVTEQEEDTWEYDKVGEKDFQKREFKILTLLQLDVGPDAEDGTKNNDALDDAVWNRNNVVQDRFNIVIGSNQQEMEAISMKVKSLKKSDDLEYHVVYQHMVSAAKLAMSGQLYNLNKIAEIDTAAPWWDKDAKSGFQVEGILYLAAGDILPSTMLNTSCMAFNKTLMDNSTELNPDGTKKLVYPYELARDGKWTLEVLENMTKDYTKDANDDGALTAKDDIFGMTGWHLASPYNFFYGSGLKMIINDGVKAPEYKYDAELIQKVYDKVYGIFVTNRSLYVMNVNDYDDVFKTFSDGRALFNCCTLSKMHGAESYFKKMTDDYGVLPQPKYDETSPYLSFINGAAAMVCVINVLEEGSKDSEFVGSVIEGLANASYNMVTYTLYEVTAKAKNVNDRDSADMVDIIIRNKVFDFGYAHFFDNQYACASLFCKMLDAQAESASTYIKRDEGQTKTALKKCLKNYSKYNN